MPEFFNVLSTDDAFKVLSEQLSQRVAIDVVDTSGGMNRRLGRNKALEPVGGERVIQRVIGLLSKVSQETVVLVADMGGR